MLSILPQLAAGAALGVAAAWMAYLAGALNRSGAFAAAAVGAIVFGLGGLNWAILLLAFFVSSSLLSQLFKGRKSELGEKFAKSSRRDASQVLANGGVASAAVLIMFAMKVAFQMRGVVADPDWMWVAYAGSLAAVNADTWATELGVLSRSAPRLITSGARVERGASGGVTGLGFTAALGGAGLIAGLAAWLRDLASVRPAGLLAAVAIGGAAGAVLDSILGSSFQAIYYCPRCEKETERHPLHSCGTPTSLIRGWAWLNNDWVNAACALGGALVAAAVWWIISRFD